MNPWALRKRANDDFRSKDLELCVLRLTHIERLILFALALFLSALTVVLSGDDEIRALWLSLFLLFPLSVVYGHLALISIAYAQEILLLERALKRNVMGNVWSRVRRHTQITIWLINFATWLITVLVVWWISAPFMDGWEGVTARIFLFAYALFYWVLLLYPTARLMCLFNEEAC